MTENTFRPPFVLNSAGQPMPGVCTSMDVSKDGLTYTLHVDPRAKFSDGSVVTAADLKFSWEYLSYPETKSTTATVVTGPIVGSADVYAGKTKDMAGLVVKDEATLIVKLSEPYTPFAKVLATFIAGVVKKENVLAGGDHWDQAPVCCGPYMVKSWDRNANEINWVPNPHWWGEKPTIENVNYRYIKDANTISIMWDNNEMDLFPPTTTQVAQMDKDPQKAKVLHQIPYGGLVFYYFHCDRKPTDDPNVRRALLKATDMGQLIQALFGKAGAAAYGIIPPNLEGYSNPKPYFDLAGAKQALAASSYKSAAALPPITVAVPTNNQDYVLLTEAVQQMWKENLGLSVTVLPYDPSVDITKNTSVQIQRLSLGTLINDPSSAASALGLSTQTPQDYGHFKNPQLDAILQKADTLPLTQQNERISLYRQAEQMILDEAYYIPIQWVQYFYAVKPWVTNYAANNDLCLYNIPAMSIAQH